MWKYMNVCDTGLYCGLTYLCSHTTHGLKKITLYQERAKHFLLLVKGCTSGFSSSVTLLLWGTVPALHIETPNYTRVFHVKIAACLWNDKKFLFSFITIQPMEWKRLGDEKKAKKTFFLIWIHFTVHHQRWNVDKSKLLTRLQEFLVFFFLLSIWFDLML